MTNIVSIFLSRISISAYSILYTHGTLYPTKSSRPSFISTVLFPYIRDARNLLLHHGFVQPNFRRLDLGVVGISSFQTRLRYIFEFAV